MCSGCWSRGAAASVCAGIALTLVVSAASYQLGNSMLSTDWASTAKVFLKYAVGVFFFGLAKWQMWLARQMHEKAGKKK